MVAVVVEICCNPNDPNILTNTIIKCFPVMGGILFSPTLYIFISLKCCYCTFSTVLYVIPIPIAMGENCITKPHNANGHKYNTPSLRCCLVYMQVRFRFQVKTFWWYYMTVIYSSQGQHATSINNTFSWFCILCYLMFRDLQSYIVLSKKTMR